MFKNKVGERNNLCGGNVYSFRKNRLKVSQRGLAVLLQLEGLDVDKNAIQRIESGQRFVTDIEVKVLSKVLAVSVEDLLKED